MSDSSSPSCAFSLMVSGMGLVLAFSIPSVYDNSVNEKRFSLQRVPVIQLSKIHRQKSNLRRLFCTSALHLACSVCLVPVPESVRRSVLALSPESHRCAFLLSLRCVLDLVRNDRTSNCLYCDWFHLHGTRENFRAVRVFQSPRCSLETWES